MPLHDLSPLDDALDRNRAAFNMVIERFISRAHGLPPPPQICPYESPHPSKNKGKSTPSSSLKNLSGSVASIKSIISPPNSKRQDSTFTEDDLVREVEESLQRRRKQLELNDNFTFEDVEDDDTDMDDPSWNGSHYYVSGNLSSRLQRKRGRKKKQTVEQESHSQNTAGELRQRSTQHKLSEGTNSPRKRGRPPQKKTSAEVCGEGKTPRKRGRPLKVNGIMKNQENANKNKSSNNPVSADTSTQPKKRGRPLKTRQTENQENPAQDRTKDTRPGDDSSIPKKRGRPPKPKLAEAQGTDYQDKTKGIRSPDNSNIHRKRGRPPQTKAAETHCQDKTKGTESDDESSIPKKRGKPFKRKAPETQNIHNQDISVRLKRPNGVSESLQSVYRSEEAGTLCSNGDTVEQGSLDIDGNIMELVKEALGGSPAVLHAMSEEKNKIICLLETLDPVYIMITQHSSSEVREGRETGRATEKEQSIRTHDNNDLEADTQQIEETVSVATSTENRINAGENQQVLGMNKSKPSRKSAVEVSTKKVGRKRGRSKTRNEFSHPSKVIQQSESTVEPPTLKKTKNGHCQGSEPISKAVKSTQEHWSGSSVPTKVQVVTQIAEDAIPLSPEENNNEMVTSSQDKVAGRLHIDKNTETEVKRQVTQKKHSYTSKPRIIPSSKASDPGICNKSLLVSTSEEPDIISVGENSEGEKMAGVSESEAEDEDGWITTGDEDDTVSELHLTKKKTFLHQPQKDLKKRKHKQEPRKSVSKIVFDDDDNDILVLEAPRPRSENKENCSNFENSQTTKGGEDKHITSLPVSPKSQTQAKKYGSEKSKRTADRHQGSMTTSGSFIQRLINNSMMKNILSTMTTSLTKVPGKSQEEDLDPENMLYLLQVPSLQQSPSSFPTSRTSESSPQGSRETTAVVSTMPAVAATTTTTTTATTFTNISDSGITSKVSKSVKSFWEMDSDAEAEEESGQDNKVIEEDDQDMESLFKSVSASQLVQESTVLPNYSTLGPERWMLVMRGMRKHKKNSFLKLPLC